jgi:hypothetical protein
MLGHHRYKQMLKTLEPEADSSQPAIYQIRIQGYLRHQWTDWFEGLTLSLEEDGATLLTGPVIDEAALHGLLKKVRDFGIPLVSVNRAEAGPATTLETGQVEVPEVKPHIEASSLELSPQHTGQVNHHTPEEKIK